MRDTKHSRVTPQGMAMGRNAARLAELGQARLVEMGLHEVKGPRLRDEMCKTCELRDSLRVRQTLEPSHPFGRNR